MRVLWKIVSMIDFICAMVVVENSLWKSVMSGLHEVTYF